MQFPEGTEFRIASSAAEDAAMVVVYGFDEIGDLGLDVTISDESTISDTSPVYGVSNRKEGGERDLVCRYEKEDAGQQHVIAACKAKERRKCEVQLPDSTSKWAFTGFFAGYKLSKPESGKSLQLSVKIGIEKETESAA
ncbi:hypothetical protein [Pseudoalteromonas sp. S16_S37]|uniref:hypothetical protein n=1 Tax=Pseudoalteromonas sp. S16_S37 TaxID=2720228 RepID=UPI0016801418|nr:hypothetical protein [Pseudoalteromonas sp. S16_S37]MBD1583499.1 hypothetical protein [Pseudoalteromonas sp. S16_S37]